MAAVGWPPPDAEKCPLAGGTPTQVWDESKGKFPCSYLLGFSWLQAVHGYPQIFSEQDVSYKMCVWLLQSLGFLRLDLEVMPKDHAWPPCGLATPRAVRAAGALILLGHSLEEWKPFTTLLCRPGGGITSAGDAGHRGGVGWGSEDPSGGKCLRLPAVAPGTWAVSAAGAHASP